MTPEGHVTKQFKKERRDAHSKMKFETEKMKIGKKVSIL